MNKLVSIIVPVHNVEKYIERCIESILGQTYKEIELLLIDDGSTDKSGNICEKYSNQDSRVKVFHKVSGGPSDARNFGLDHIKGEFITFIDSDDFISKWYVEYLLHLIEKHDADMSVCQYRESAETSFNFEHSAETAELVCSQKEAFERYCYQRGIAQNVWGKMYVKRVYQSLRFPKNQLYEDEGIFYKVLDKCRKVVIGNQIHYFYYKRSDSIIRSNFTIAKYDYVVSSINLTKYIKEKYPDLYIAAVSKLLWSCIHIWVQLPNKEEYPEIYNNIVKIIKKNRLWVIRDPKVRVKNKILLLGSFLGQKFLRRIYLLLK